MDVKPYIMTNSVDVYAAERKQNISFINHQEKKHCLWDIIIIIIYKIYINIKG